jgi:hypothetical protein
MRSHSTTRAQSSRSIRSRSPPDQTPAFRTTESSRPNRSIMAATAASAEGAEPSSYRTGNTASDVAASSRAGPAEEK